MSGALKPNNVIRIPCTEDTLFRYWLEFLIPFHNLTSRETDVATAFLRERHNLSKVILDDNLIDRDMSIPVYKAFTQEVKQTLNRNLIDTGDLERQGKSFVRGGIKKLLIPSTHIPGINIYSF